MIGVPRLEALRRISIDLYETINSIWQNVRILSLGVRSGRVTLVAGQGFVKCEIVNADSVITATHVDFGGTTGHLSTPLSLRQPAKSFTIVSSDVADTGTVDWTLTNVPGGA